MAVPRWLRRILDHNGIAYEVHRHPPVFPVVMKMREIAGELRALGLPAAAGRPPGLDRERLGEQTSRSGKALADAEPVVLPGHRD